MKKILFAAMIVCASAGTATAGGQPGSVGVGGELSLSGPGGVSINFDAGAFHLGGFLGFFDADGPDNTLIELGGRFFYHISSTAMSDFSVGGTLAYRNDEAEGPDGSSELFLEPSFQIRAFLSSNVALSFTGGISIGLMDASAVDLDAHVTGSAGVHYYF